MYLPVWVLVVIAVVLLVDSVWLIITRLARTKSTICTCRHDSSNHFFLGKGSCVVSTRPGYTCACMRFTARKYRF